MTSKSQLKRTANQDPMALYQENQRLLAALKELDAMYAHCWDLVDGGLTIMPPSIPRFEAAHFAARVAIRRAEGATECICDWADDRNPSAKEEETRICDDCGLKIIV